MRTARSVKVLGVGLALATAVALSGCGAKKEATSAPTTIQVKGSDTMVNVAQAWAEEYKKVAPNVDVEVSGGGSGVGIAALEKGTIDIADASRNMKPEEIEQAKRNTGKEPKEFVVGYDALGVYVPKDNPIDEISLDQLGQIFVEGGTITKWSQLGVKIPGAVGYPRPDYRLGSSNLKSGLICRISLTTRARFSSRSGVGSVFQAE